MLSPGKRIFMTELSPSRRIMPPLANLTGGYTICLNNGLLTKNYSPLKISPVINVLTSNNIAKRRSTIQSLMDFDTDCKMRPTKRLVSIEPPTLLSENERMEIKKICTFSEKEIHLLMNLFLKVYNAQTGNISQSVYWTLIEKVSPLLYKDSLLRTHLSHIFQTTSKDYFTPIEFILSIAVLYQRAKFMSSEQLVYDVLNRDNTGILDTSIFSDLPTSNGSDLLFIVEYPGGKLEITRTMFIETWNRYIKQYMDSKQIVLDEFIEVLHNHSCSTILMYPFYINGTIESLCNKS